MSGAVLAGGPGALLWMWIIAFFGMATIYAEAVLSQKTRKISLQGTAYGGPVYYIRKAFKGKTGTFLASFFALSAMLTLGFMGIMVQSNAISSSMNSAFNLKPQITGVAVAFASWGIFSGGIKRTASVTEKLVPFMAMLYIAGGIVILALRIKYIPESIEMILKYAFKPNAIIGGGIGTALKTTISQGVKRGLFSNEAGMGSTPHAHAVADVKHPHDQGVVAMMGVFIDTFVILTITGLAVVSTLYAGGGPLSPNAVSQAAEGITKNNMVQIAASITTGSYTVGNTFTAVCLFFFAFSTIISWNYFGRINADYLLGKKFIPAYTIISVIFIFLGSVLSDNMVWSMADMFNQLMVIPNVLALTALSDTVAKESKKK